jgi:hypothetical protein
MIITPQQYFDLFKKEFESLRSKMKKEGGFPFFKNKKMVKEYTRFISFVQLSIITKIQSESSLHLLCEFFPNMEILDKNKERSDYLIVESKDGVLGEILVIVEHENKSESIDDELKKLFQLINTSSLKIFIGYYSKNKLDDQLEKIESYIVSVEEKDRNLLKNYLFIFGPNTHKEDNLPVPFLAYGVKNQNLINYS